MSAQPNVLSEESDPRILVTEYRDLGELERIRATWDGLVAQGSGSSIFLTTEWLFSWWHAYGGDKRFCVLLLTDAQTGVAVGIVPLYWDRVKPLALPELRVLRLMGDGSGDSDDLDFIVKPGYASAVTKAFLCWMRNAPWDICEFHCLSSKSEVAKLLGGSLSVLGWKSATSLRPQARVELPETWDLYLKQLSAKERGKIGLRLRRVQAQHQVFFRRCEHPDELPTFLKTLYSLHQKRWAARSEPGSFSLPARLRFYDELTRNLQGRGWLELWQFEMDQVPVAAQIGMRYNNCFYSLQEGFDPAFASDSVGYVLRSHVLRRCIDTGIRVYDFLYGNQESKRRWGADVGHYVDIQFARPGSLGYVYLASHKAFRICKDWLRAHTPAKVWTKLQTLRNVWEQQRPIGEELVKGAVEVSAVSQQPISPETINPTGEGRVGSLT